MATTKNLEIDQGASFVTYHQYLDNDKIPISLANHTVASQMRRSFFSANATVITASIVDAANGNIQLSLNSANTSNLVSGRYVYDVAVTSNVSTTRVLEGLITVNPRVTVI